MNYLSHFKITYIDIYVGQNLPGRIIQWDETSLDETSRDETSTVPKWYETSNTRLKSYGRFSLTDNRRIN